MRLRFVDSPVGVFCVFLVIYLLTLTSNFTAPHDSMAYLNMLKTEEGLWHPHHLLYHVTSKYWLAIWKPVFPSTEDYLLVESFSSVWGAAVLAMVYAFFRKRFDLPAVTAWLCTAVAGFSYGIWFYSVNVEVYMPALFFTIWSLFILSKKEWSSKQIWQISIVHSLAILFHQMNILLFPIILYKIYTQRHNIYVLKSFFWYGLIGLVLVGGFYFIGGWIIEGNNNFASWISWIRGYTHSDAYWLPLSWKTPVFAAMGFLRTIIGGQFLFALGGMENSIGAFLKVHALQDEAFLVRNLSQGIVWTALILSLVLGAFILLLLVQFIARFKTKMRTWNHAIVPLILYVVIYSAYFFFWMPEILEFWLGQCIICWLLLLGTYRYAGRRPNIIAATMALLLIIINYTTSIRPMRDVKNDIGYARIEKVKQTATANDLLIVQDPWLLKEFLEYYTKAPVIVIPQTIAEQTTLLQRIDGNLSMGNRVFVFGAKENVHDKWNKDFIPALQKKYGGRMNVFQEELVPVWVIE